MEISEQAQEHHQRYLRAAHAMQSGVAMNMNYEPSETDPKHMRVGVNSAMIEHAALVDVLVEKGLITHEEFFKSLADKMELEVRRYEATLEKRLGRKVTLL